MSLGGIYDADLTVVFRIVPTASICQKADHNVPILNKGNYTDEFAGNGYGTVINCRVCIDKLDSIVEIVRLLIFVMIIILNCYLSIEITFILFKILYGSRSILRHLFFLHIK